MYHARQQKRVGHDDVRGNHTEGRAGDRTAQALGAARSCCDRAGCSRGRQQAVVLRFPRRHYR
eukprot:3414699-Prymnesium_polylepis.1